jgi:type I restriction enzyme S subunit
MLVQSVYVPKYCFISSCRNSLHRLRWPVLTLRDLIDRGDAELQTGPFGTMLHAKAYTKDGIPVVAVKNIGDNRLLDDDIPRVDQEITLGL